jgi:hypothetical protein
MYCAAHRRRVELRATERPLALRPPAQLARVGENDCGRRITPCGRLLSYDNFNEQHHRTCINTSGSADHAVGEHAEVLHGLAEDEDDTLGLKELGWRTGVDGNARCIWSGVQREMHALEAFSFEAGGDDALDRACGFWLDRQFRGQRSGGYLTVKIKALAIIDSLILAEKIFEVELGVFNIPDFVLVVDKISSARNSAQLQVTRKWK